MCINMLARLCLFCSLLLLCQGSRKNKIPYRPGVFAPDIAYVHFHPSTALRFCFVSAIGSDSISRDTIYCLPLTPEDMREKIAKVFNIFGAPAHFCVPFWIDYQPGMYIAWSKGYVLRQHGYCCFCSSGQIIGWTTTSSTL